MHEDRSVTVYSDGSYRDDKAGAGVVLCHHGRVLLKSVHLGSVPSSLIAETAAACEAIAAALRVARQGDRILLRTDCEYVSGYFNALGRKRWDRHLSSWLRPLVKAAGTAGISIDAARMRGHGDGKEDYSTQESFFNGVTDALADFGRKGECVEKDFPAGDSVRRDIVGFDKRLDPDSQYLFRSTYSRTEAAERIGVQQDTVDRLVRFGHLKFVPEVSRITKYSVHAVALEFVRMREAAGPVMDSPSPGF